MASGTRQNGKTRADPNDPWAVEALGTGASRKEAVLYATLRPELGPDPAKWSPAFARIAWRLHPPESLLDLQNAAVHAADARRRHATHHG